MPGKSPSPGTHTHAAFRKKFDEKRAHEEQLQLALEFMEAGRGGARAVSKLVEGCSRRQIAGALAKATSPAATRPNWQILTPTETGSLVRWLLASARNDNPACEADVTVQVAKMLQCRRLANRRHHSGKAGSSRVALSRAEERIAIGGGELSHTWFQRFYGANPSCQMKTAHKQEAKRVWKQG